MPIDSEASYPGDEDVRVNVINTDAQVVVTFSKPVEWLRLSFEDARQLAMRLTVRADQLERLTH